MKELLIELLKESSCEYQILGSIGNGNSDTDVIFKDENSLSQFKEELILRLALGFTWKIELFNTRVFKQECKFHIYKAQELYGQLDLWLVVQRKGNILYKYDNKNTVQRSGLSFVNEDALAEYKKKKMRFSISCNAKYLALVVKNYIKGFDWYYFYGVDGVGKSSQIELFRECFYNEVIVVHTMPRILRKRRSVKGDGIIVREDKPMSIFKSILYAIYWILEVLIFRLSTGKKLVVIFDRGPLEVVVQEVYHRIPELLRKVLFYSHKTYNNAVVLTGDASTIWRRKMELTLDRTRIQITKYEQLKLYQGVNVLASANGIERVNTEVKINLLNE